MIASLLEAGALISLNTDDPAQFASGIWEALVTTAVGLTVAIPAFIFYKYLLARVSRLLVEMEERSLKLIDLVAQD